VPVCPQDLWRPRAGQRFFQTVSPAGPLDQAALRRAIALYRERVEALLAEAPAEVPSLAGEASPVAR
jgi:hypothetical protein